MSTAPVIVGAGLAGLLAAHAWPTLAVREAAPAPAAVHRAVLRFRNDSVAQLTGIEFRRVRVHKGIWAAGRFTPPNIRVANQYANKVLGALGGDRSIWNTDPVDRYVAPDTLYEQLVEACEARIEWGAAVDFSSFGGTLISTAPLPVTLRQLGLPTLKCDRAPITVVRARVPGADVFQTVYFPDEETPMYRASITGDNLIIEAAAGADIPASREWLPRALVLCERAFALRDVHVLGAADQKYGKIVPLPDADRKRALFTLTHQHNVYSLGRFATWRNILLDDVVSDIAVIKRMMRSSLYDVRRDAGI